MGHTTCNKEREIGVILTKLDELHDKFDKISTGIEKNTEFRLKANGIIGFVSFVSMCFGSLILWSFQKIIGGAK